MNFPIFSRKCRALGFDLLQQEVMGGKQVNPHLFLQVVMEPSEKCFSTDAQSDPAEFMLWLLKALHADL
ncbi:hypothetical protein T459_23573 [Capsicum annuum]|uniref:Uncharacterized protein n=1 Tax=Capsicum annuum TaxID=4072 RepID=A0A2G2YSP5_CAPAN|nr:hypothetical protein T459_23573 [Capsicum annuum]